MKNETMYDRIKRLREEQGMSQTELAKKCGYSNRSTITKIEKGERNLSSGKIQKIANALGVKPSVLMDGEDEINDISSEILALLEAMPEQKRENAIEYLKFLSNQNDK